MVKEEVTKEHIERRIVDWIQRISDLYDNVEIWVKSAGYSPIRKSSVQMYEELMEKFNIEPITLDLLNIYEDNNIIAILKPMGLWIIGANGRIDILYKNGSITLVDKAEKFKKADWYAFSSKNWKSGEKFTKDYFIQLLNE